MYLRSVVIRNDPLSDSLRDSKVSRSHIGLGFQRSSIENGIRRWHGATSAIGMEWRRSGPDGICLLHNVVNFPRSWPDDGANVTGFKESHSKRTCLPQQHPIYANSTLALQICL